MAEVHGVSVSKLALIAVLMAASSVSGDSNPEIAAAREAVAAYAGALKSELSAAMKAGGPVAAIEVCHLRAPQISETVSTQENLAIGRVSLRNRNPENAPNDWQRAVLEAFEERQKAGDDPANLTWHEITHVDGERVFRFMKAIPTEGLCLACHGENLAPGVSARLSELYPQDKATGYQAGDIRGAFVVVQRSGPGDT